MNKFREYYTVWKIVVLSLITLLILTDLDKDRLFDAIVSSYLLEVEQLINIAV